MPALIGLLGSNAAGNPFTAADGDVGNIEAVQLADSNGVQALYADDNTDGNVPSATANKLVVITRAQRHNGANWDREKKPLSSLVFRLPTSAANNNAQAIAATPRNLFSVSGTNTTAAVLWVHIYNKATTPTPGTDVPVFSFAIPATATGGKLCESWPNGVWFTAGIAISLSTDAAGTVAPGAGALLGLNIAVN